MSEPGPDYSQAISDAFGVALGGVAGHREYRVSPVGDVTPTSGASLDDVLDAPDLMAGRPEVAGEEAYDPPPPSPVDVSAMGGAINQWWVDDDDAAETQAIADTVNAAAGGAAVPGSDGVDVGWQPFPPGPPDMVVQVAGEGVFGVPPPPGAGFGSPTQPPSPTPDIVPGDMPGWGEWR